MAGFRFVTVLGQGSDTACWSHLLAELKQRKIFVSSNIEELRVESIFKLHAEILENVRHPSCIGIVALNLVVPLEASLVANIPNDYLFVQDTSWSWLPYKHPVEQSGIIEAARALLDY